MEHLNLTLEENEILNAAIEEALTPIPENSPSLLIDEKTSRFSSAIWFDEIKKQEVVIAGLGGIGSWLSLLLSRLQMKGMYLFDMDIVDISNVSGQLYKTYNVGKRKTASITDIIREFSSNYATSSFDEYNNHSMTSNIMICGFDNMEARKTFYYNWKKRVNFIEDKDKCLFIDGRLSADCFQILCIQGNDAYNMNKYEKDYLFTDEEADPTICSFKQTSFMANMIASYMVNLFVNFIANQCNPIIPKDVPFYTEYNADNLYSKIIF